jgi:hypothetical protein
MAQAIRTGQSLVDKAIDALWDALDRLKNAITTDRIQSIALTTTDTIIAHGLGRPYKGYSVVSSSAAGVVTTSPTANLDQANVIILRASTAGTYGLVFV